MILEKKAALVQEEFMEFDNQDVCHTRIDPFPRALRSWLNTLTKQPKCTVKKKLPMSKMCLKNLSSTGRNNTSKQ